MEKKAEYAPLERGQKMTFKNATSNAMETVITTSTGLEVSLTVSPGDELKTTGDGSALTISNTVIENEGLSIVKND